MTSMDLFQFIFVALTALEAILFSVFGTLYSVYVQYMVKVRPPAKDAISSPDAYESLLPAEITETLKRLCWMITGLIWMAAIGASVALWNLPLQGVLQYTVGVGVTVLLMAIGVPALIVVRRMS